jgi:hypothetical protein
MHWTYNGAGFTLVSQSATIRDISLAASLFGELDPSLIDGIVLSLG